MFGAEAYSQRTVYRLMKEYENGRLNVGDKVRPGQPLTSRKPEKMKECETLVLKNRRSTIAQLSRTLGISYGSTFQILHKDLLMKKRASKLVPHALTAGQKRQRIQFCVDFLDSFPNGTGSALNYILTTDEAWFYLIETRSRLANLQWLRKGEDRDQVPRRPRSCKKVLLIPFFDRNGF